MLNWLLSLDAAGWSTLFAGFGFFVVTIGTIIAIRNLVVIRRTHELQAFQSFIEELQASAEDRKFLFQYKFPQDMERITQKDFQRLENVVNFLNRIGLLIENSILPPKFVFGMTHTVIIRCCYKLREFLRFQEERIGGRYGRRLDYLEKRAKLYHDVRPQHRITKLKIHEGSHGSRVIYETEFKHGWEGLLQQAVWFIRDLFNLY